MGAVCGAIRCGDTRLPDTSGIKHSRQLRRQGEIMKRALSGCAGLAVLATITASAIPANAHPVNGNLPGGTSITVSIDSPADGAVLPPGVVSIQGTASVGQGQPVPSTALIYVLDVSSSTQTPVAAGCGGDQNGDGDLNNILDCEVLAAKTLKIGRAHV